MQIHAIKNRACCLYRVSLKLINVDKLQNFKLFLQLCKACLHKTFISL